MAKSKSSGGWIILVVILAAAAGCGWYFWQQNADKAPEFMTSTVTRGTLTQTVTATGTLQAVTTVDVSSQISGNVAKVYVDWNSPVKKGQVLAEIDPSNYQTALNQADGQLANAKANYALMKANADRTLALFNQHLVPQSDLDTANDIAQSAFLVHQLAHHGIAAQEKLADGYRLVCNCGAHACESVQHLHFHLLGGRAFGWPPG